MMVVKRPKTAFLILLFLFAFASCGRCCEPILPLYQLLSGSSLAGAALLTHSLLWLLAAVAIKCGAFVFLERKLAWHEAGLYMLVANVVSTIPGVLVGVTAASLGGIVVAVPLVGVLGWMVQRRVAWIAPESRVLRWLSGGKVALAFAAFFFVSVAIYAAADNAIGMHNFAAYWLLKFLFVTMVAMTGMLISAVLEECVIAWLSRAAHGNWSFYGPVLRANYVTLAVVLLVAALEILPRRWHAPHFIVAWVHAVAATLGLG